MKFLLASRRGKRATGLLWRAVDTSCVKKPVRSSTVVKLMVMVVTDRVIAVFQRRTEGTESLNSAIER